jgi:hypothetical protein
VGSVFTVKVKGDRQKYVKMCPAFSVDSKGKDAIFLPRTPVRLIGRVKIGVVDYS